MRVTNNPYPGVSSKGFKSPLALRFRYLSAQCLRESLKIQKNRPKAVVFEAAGCAVAQAQTLELIALLVPQRGQRLLLCCHKRSKQTRQSRLPKSQFFS